MRETVLSDDVPAAAGRASIPAQHLTPHAASILNLALVSSDALYQTAEAIQACLVDVLQNAFLLQEASEQQIADLHAKLDESDERAGAL